MRNTAKRGLQGSYSIEFNDFLYEYAKNAAFKKIVDSGNFIFADNRLVINDRKYIAIDEYGIVYLTEYAEDNEQECCLFFEYKYIQSDRDKRDFIKSISRVQTFKQAVVSIGGKIRKVLRKFLHTKPTAPRKVIAQRFDDWDHLGGGTDDFEYESIPDSNRQTSKPTFDKPAAPSNELYHSGDRRILQEVKTPVFNADIRNIEVFKRSEDLKKLSDDIIDKAVFMAENVKDFSKLAWANMERCNCHYKEIFRERTLLSDKTFDRIKAGKLHNPGIETVMATCIGLNLGTLHGEPLLRSAGYDIANSTSPLNMVYYVLLCSYQGHSIFECNEVLESLNLPLIRGKAYKETVESITA
jgi:hypothetical protein